MLLTTEKTETNCGAGEKFKIVESPIAFEILSSKLYSNPILAMVRELITNAIDSHKAANVDLPVQVTLPNRLNTNFIVEDFGLGMSEEKIMNLYTTFFMSDKNVSNDLTGCFGLGSKTPFAVTSAFTIRSRYEGMEYMFSCVKVDGYPKVLKIYEKETSLHNGVTISVPINNDDMPNVIHSYKKFIQFLDGINVKSNMEIDPEEVKWVLEHEGIKAKFYTTYDDATVNFLVRQGDNVYELSEKYINTTTDDIYVLTSSGPVVLEFPIGEIDITPSREHIAESVSNKERIQNALKAFSKIAKEKILSDDKYDIEVAGASYRYGQKLNEIIGENVISYIGKDHIRLLSNKRIFHKKSVFSNAYSNELLRNNDYTVVFNAPNSYKDTVKDTIVFKKPYNVKYEARALKVISEIKNFGINMRFISYKAFKSEQQKVKKKRTCINTAHNCSTTVICRNTNDSNKFVSYRYDKIIEKKRIDENIEHGAFVFVNDKSFEQKICLDYLNILLGIKTISGEYAAQEFIDRINAESQVMFIGLAKSIIKKYGYETIDIVDEVKKIIRRDWRIIANKFSDYHNYSIDLDILSAIFSEAELRAIHKSFPFRKYEAFRSMVNNKNYQRIDINECNRIKYVITYLFSSEYADKKCQHLNDIKIHPSSMEEIRNIAEGMSTIKQRSNGSVFTGIGKKKLFQVLIRGKRNVLFQD